MCQPLHMASPALIDPMRLNRRSPAKGDRDGEPAAEPVGFDMTADPPVPLGVEIRLRRADGHAWPLYDPAALPPEDLARAARFVSPRDAALWREARFLLRSTLAARLGGAPARLALTRGPHGKPATDAPLRFSLSHAADLALLALADDGHAELGADIEPEERPIAPELFAAATAPEEAGWLDGLPAHRRGRAFLVLWTLKESVLKAAGTGLYQSPAAIVFDPRTLRLQRLPPAIGPAEDYSLHILAAPAGHLAALAVRDPLRRPVRIIWPDA